MAGAAVQEQPASEHTAESAANTLNELRLSPAGAQVLASMLVLDSAPANTPEARRALEDLVAIIGSLDKERLAELSKELVAAGIINDPQALAALDAALTSPNKEKGADAIRGLVVRALVERQAAERACLVPAESRFALPESDYYRPPAKYDAQTQAHSSIPEMQIVEAPPMPIKTLAEIFEDSLKTLAEAAASKDAKHKRREEDNRDPSDQDSSRQKLQQSIREIAARFPELGEVLEKIQSLPPSAFEVSYIPWVQVMELLEEERGTSRPAV